MQILKRAELDCSKDIHSREKKKKKGNVSPLYISQDKDYYLLINDIWNVLDSLLITYSMQAESLESHGVWQFFLYFFPIKKTGQSF